VFLTGQGGDCVSAANAADAPGVLANVLPGYPGQTPALVGIVADSVTLVRIVVNDQSNEVPVVNSSIYANLNNLKAGDRVELRATYDDGSTWVFPLFNVKGETRRPSQLVPHPG
jgi:hypothetical protein